MITVVPRDAHRHAPPRHACPCKLAGEAAVIRGPYHQPLIIPCQWPTSRPGAPRPTSPRHASPARREAEGGGRHTLENGGSRRQGEPTYAPHHAPDPLPPCPPRPAARSHSDVPTTMSSSYWYSDETNQTIWVGGRGAAEQGSDATQYRRIPLLYQSLADRRR